MARDLPPGLVQPAWPVAESRRVRLDHPRLQLPLTPERDWTPPDVTCIEIGAGCLEELAVVLTSVPVHMLRRQRLAGRWVGGSSGLEAE